MRKAFKRVGVLLLACVVWVVSYELGAPAGRSGDVALEVRAESTSLRVGEEPRMRVVVRNGGRRAVRLVEPGDGSESGWRTPVFEWSVIKVGADGSSCRRVRDDRGPAVWAQVNPGEEARHPAAPSTEMGVRDCGNVRGLRWGEVFGLAPGESKELFSEGMWYPPFAEPGVYRVALLYANRPSMDWHEGGGVGFHNPLEMWRVRQSTEAVAVSNEVVFTVRD